MSDHNVINFQPRPPQEKGPVKKTHPPMFNIPPATKLLAGIMIGIQAVIFILSMTIMPNALSFAAYFAGFVPSAWTGLLGGEGHFEWWTPFSLIGFSFLHGGWLHLAFNIVMLVAMGSGLEKAVGIKKYMIVYAVTTFFAVLTHFALYPNSDMPIVGASGGISGIFGAMIVLMNQTRNTIAGETKSTLMPVIIAYLGITIVMGLMGAPDGSSIAWIAHIGGFLAGVGLMMTWTKRQK